MLHLWIGRAGAGKTARVLETIEKNRHERDQLLIVPEHVSHEAEVELCRALGDTASRNAEVLSLRNLSGRVLGEVGGLADFTLDGGGKLLTMRMALQEVGSGLRVFDNPSRRQKTTFDGILNMMQSRYNQNPNMYEYYEQFMIDEPCPDCGGGRLNPAVLGVTVGGKNIHEVCRLSGSRSRNSAVLQL